MKLKYVFSAPSMMRIQPCGWKIENPEEWGIAACIIKEGVERLRKDVGSAIPDVDFGIDVLFNAFTEEKYGEWIREHSNFGFDKIYADSGGLQIVTAGKTADAAMKERIYKTQSVSDYAMVFDEIPAGSIGAISKGSRAQTSDKLYHYDRNEEKATKTAHNIKEQINILNKYDTQTKVHYIIQGNTHQDMLEWFDYGTKVLNDSHFDKIGGLALADTCMGNGPLESIDMLVAYNRIYNDFGIEKTKEHIHLLGVGSVGRMMPAIYLMKSGFVPEGVTVSFDSSSFSQSYMMGKFTDAQGKIVQKDPRGYKKMFGDVFDYFEDIYRKHIPGIDKEEFVQYLVDGIRSVTLTTNDAKPEFRSLVRASTPLTNFWQILGFVENIKRALEQSKHNNSAVGLLQEVRNYDDYRHWHNNYSRYVTSRRIGRADMSTLDEFF